MSANTRKGRPNVPARLITDDHGHRDLYRQCSRCHVWRTVDGFHVRGRNPRTGAVTRWDAWCRDCRNIQQRDRWHRLAPEHRAKLNRTRRASVNADPEKLARRRAQARATYRRRYARDRDGLRETRRRSVEKLRADPERLARQRAIDRINARLRAERQGRQVTRRARTADDAWHPSGGNDGDRRLDPRPLREWLEAVIADEQHAEGFELHRLCQTLGVQDRQLRAIRHGEYATVGLHVADRLLTGYGRPVVIRSRDLERRLLTWAQGLPGNGTRLLAYLDRAEAVGHIADIAVLRVDDLYPELDG